MNTPGVAGDIPPAEDDPPPAGGAAPGSDAIDSVPDAVVPASDRVPAPTEPAEPAEPAEPDASGEPRRPVIGLSAASADVDVAAAETALPGEHHGGFARLPTAPLDVQRQSGPAEQAGDAAADDGTSGYDPADTVVLDRVPTAPSAGPRPQATRHRHLAGWALALAIIALVGALFGAWGLPVGVAALVMAIPAVRRGTARTAAVWALALAVLSVLYGAGWLVWSLGQL